MIIRVTEKHIQKGSPRTWGSCPVALAFRDAGHPGTWVSRSTIRIPRLGCSPLPDQVALFIQAFDHGWPVQPFEFELEV